MPQVLPLQLPPGVFTRNQGHRPCDGEPGVGKTTALRAYLKQLNPASYHVCYFALSTLNVREFLSGLAVELGESPAFQRVKTIRLIQQTIQSMFHERKATQVIVLGDALGIQCNF